MEDYEKLLTELCTSVEDFILWKKVLREELRSEDIDDRKYYFAATKTEIEEAVKRIQTIITRMRKQSSE